MFAQLVFSRALTTPCRATSACSAPWRKPPPSTGISPTPAGKTWKRSTNATPTMTRLPQATSASRSQPSAGRIYRTSGRIWGWTTFIPTCSPPTCCTVRKGRSRKCRQMRPSRSSCSPKAAPIGRPPCGTARGSFASLPIRRPSSSRIEIRIPLDRQPREAQVTLEIPET